MYIYIYIKLSRALKLVFVHSQGFRDRDVWGFGFSQPIFTRTYHEDASFPSPRGTCPGKSSKWELPFRV